MASSPPSGAGRKHNLRQTLRGPQRVDSTDERELQQAGRSSTNLNAQITAQSMRQTSRESSRPSSQHTSPTQSRQQSRRPSRQQHLASIDDEDDTGVAPHDTTRDSRSDDTQISISESPKLSSQSPSVDTENHAESAPAESIISRSSITRPALRTLIAPSTTSQSQQPLPRSYRDLGSDYNRYYNPFASRNPSQQDLSTPLPRSHSATHLLGSAVGSSADLHRLSNPFQDSRQSHYSDSINNTAPGTPQRRTSLPVNDGEVAVMAKEATQKDSHTPMADPEKMQFYPFVDDRLSAPHTLPLYTDVTEEDDDMHMPQWDDDAKFRPTFRERFTVLNIVNTLGALFLIFGLATVFVMLPILAFTGVDVLNYGFETPLDQMPGFVQNTVTWATVNNRTYPMLQNVRAGLIDPETPASAMTRPSSFGKNLQLVFSDEFNAQNRTFYPGDDPYWFAPNIWYGATQDLEWYDPDAVNTGDGTLSLQLDQFPNHNLDFRSGMLNSWNQLCFKGGVFEVSMSLPGPAGVHGLWPGAWTMGNLGRPGYLATTDGLWPYTYNDCDAGITPNQSMTDGTSYLPGQRLPSCTCPNEDHPTPGKGRGAPEIDIAEVSADWAGKGLSVATQSYQVAPFDIWYYPNYEFMETPNYNISYVNTYTGGPYQEAVSTTSMLNNSWYDGEEYQKYAFEYYPGSDKNAGITWTIGGEETMHFDARAVSPNGNIGQRLISEEPMSMILNLGISHSWVDINFPALRFPTIMRIDYVRIYQPEGEEMVTCDPPGYETTEYIRNHPQAYNNPNVTKWAEAGFDWPTNSFMHGCPAAQPTGT